MDNYYSAPIRGTVRLVDPGEVLASTKPANMARVGEKMVVRLANITDMAGNTNSTSCEQVFNPDVYQRP
eukprot:m.733552 g.733552  ORF g.733552 m.733552 type:complete len:69 (-) comp58877_c0_seq4:1308-1514(-)